MILTAGLTPAWQQVLLFDSFTPGEVNRARQVHWCASGKVLNAARALHSLGGPSKALAPVGGTPGQESRRDFARTWVKPWSKRLLSSTPGTAYGKKSRAGAFAGWSASAPAAGLRLGRGRTGIHRLLSDRGTGVPVEQAGVLQEKCSFVGVTPKQSFTLQPGREFGNSLPGYPQRIQDSVPRSPRPAPWIAWIPGRELAENPRILCQNSVKYSIHSLARCAAKKP